MKNKIILIITVISCIIASVIYSSCEDMMGDFLEKAPSSDTNEDTVFSSAKYTIDFLATIYKLGIHSNHGYGGGNNPGYRFANPDPVGYGGASDESETSAAWYGCTQNWNSGTMNANTGQAEIDGRFDYRFKAIRMITIMLDRIDGVPDIEVDRANGMPAALKSQIKAEVKVIRALNYLEMLKRYGGVPIIDHRLSVDDDLKIPRATFRATVDFILQDCREALNEKDFPDKQLGADRGRVHKGVALAIISKTLLYAASPLFNTETPYLSFGNPELDSLICYKNYSKERWLEAAKAARDVLEWARDGGYFKLVTDQGIDRNYEYTWDIYDNPEVILAEKSMPSIGGWDWPWGDQTMWHPINWGSAGTQPTLDFIKKYEMRDGTKATWVGLGETGYDLQEKLLSLDRRFNQTVQYNMSKLNADRLYCPMFQEARPVTEGPGTHWDHAIEFCHTGFYIHKTLPYIMDSKVWTYQPNSTLFQLNEFYLNYAEAVFEYYGSGDATLDGYLLTPRQVLNTLRSRVGQPAINEGIYGSFREAIRNERAVELAFDNHRFWDVRRWMIADDGINNAMRGPKQGIIINLIDPTRIMTDPNKGLVLDNINLDLAPFTEGYKYTPVVFETRTFLRRMYLHPFQINEVMKGYLDQNPGY
jgi:hypothetical protein